MSKSSKDASLQTLARLLGEAFTLHQKGSAGARLGRSYGVADGYMLALLDMGVATQKELTRVVVDARAAHLGAATRVVAVPDAADEQAATPSAGRTETRAA